MSVFFNAIDNVLKKQHHPGGLCDEESRFPASFLSRFQEKLCVALVPVW